MSYVVLARKFRPQTFDEMTGQGHVITTLKEAIRQERIAHAYLFAGPRGVGKTSTARIFAKALNCAKGPTPEPCGKCGPCASITAGSSLDVIEIDGASNRGIDDIRQLREQVKLSTAGGRFKVYIIDEVHQITTDGFDALLKTLEEPPAHVKFVFATTAPHKVPLTILSRCQRFDFKRLSRAQIVDNVRRIAQREKIQASDEALEMIARSAEGSLRDAQMTLDRLVTVCQGQIGAAEVEQHLGWIAREAMSGLVQHLLDRKAAEALVLLDEWIQAGRDVSQVSIHLQEFLRHLMLVKSDPQLAETLELSAEDAQALRAQSDSVTLEETLYLVQLVVQAQEGIRRSPLPRVPLELALVKMAQRDNFTALPELLNRLKALEDSLKGRPPAPPTAGVTSPSTTPANVVTPAPSQPKGDLDLPPRQAAQAVAVDPPLASGAPLTFDEFIERWPQVIQRLKGVKMSVASYLEAGAPVKLERAVLTIGFTKDYSFHKESLDRLDSKKVIEQGIAEVSGAAVHVQFETVDALPAIPALASLADPVPSAAPPHAAQPSAQAHIINEALRIFGGKVINPRPAP